MKKISLETAKLLGLPFGWRGYRPHKFVYTKEGLKLHLYIDCGWWQHDIVDIPWLKELASLKGDPFLIEDEDLATWARCSKTKKELEDERNSATG